MKKNLFLVVAALLLALFLAGCGTQQTAGTEEKSETETKAPKEEAVVEKPTELTFQHALGETTVSVNPEKVIVFDFGALDTLDKLGIEITGIPQTNIPPYLSKYKEATYTNVGSLKEPDFEKIAEISPDLIIISGRQRDLYEEFTKLGPTLFLAVDTKDYLNSFTSNMETLGQIFGKEAEVAEELAKINEVIATVSEKATTLGTGLIVLANEGNISAFGPGSRFGLIHDVLGIQAADEKIEVSTHGMNVSFEYIVEKNPDYLFVVDRNTVVAGEAAAQNTIENELVQKTKAFQSGNIIYLDPNYWYLSGVGLVSVSEMVKQIEEGIK